MAQEPITVRTTVHATPERVWQAYVMPSDVMQWNSASPDWYTPSADSDLRPGGVFVYRMAARDGSFAFDFRGVYGEVTPYERITYTLDDGRAVSVTFDPQPDGVAVTVTFDAEAVNSRDLQQAGWQAILDHFRRYVEAMETTEGMV